VKKLLLLLPVVIAAGIGLWQFTAMMLPSGPWPTLDEMQTLAQDRPDLVVQAAALGLAWAMWLLLLGYTLAGMASNVRAVLDESRLEAQLQTADRRPAPDKTKKRKGKDREPADPQRSITLVVAARQPADGA
jgi:hypothetical protein